MTVVEALRSCSLFLACTDQELSMLQDEGEVIELETGALVQNRNEPGLGFRLLISGALKVEFAHESEHTRLLTSGDYWGYFALMQKQLHSQSKMIVMDTAKVFRIDYVAFEKVCQSQIALKYKLAYNILQQHIQDLKPIVKQLSLRS